MPSLLLLLVFSICYWILFSFFVVALGPSPDVSHSYSKWQNELTSYASWNELVYYFSLLPLVGNVLAAPRRRGFCRSRHRLWDVPSLWSAVLHDSRLHSRGRQQPDRLHHRSEVLTLLTLLHGWGDLGVLGHGLNTRRALLLLTLGASIYFHLFSKGFLQYR